MRFLWKSRRSPLLRSLAALQEHVGSVRAGESSPHTLAAAFHLVMRLMINAWILIYQMRNFFFPRGSNMNNRVCRAYICIHDTWREVDVGLLVEWVTNYPPPHWDSCSDRKGGGEEHLARSVCWMFVLSEASYRIKGPPTVLTKPRWVTKRRRWTLVNMCAFCFLTTFVHILIKKHDQAFLWNLLNDDMKPLKMLLFFYLQITKMHPGFILIIAVPTIGKIKIRDANSESSRSV